MLVGLAVSVAEAQSLIVPLFDDKLLNEAVSDVSRMKEKELDILTDAYVACFPLADSDNKRRQSCQEKGDRFIIEFGQGRGIDVLWLHLVTAFGLDWKFRPDAQRQFFDRASVVGPKIRDALSAGYRSQRNK